MTQIKLIDMKATSSEMTYIYIYIYIKRRTAVSTSASLYKRLYQKKEIKSEVGEER